MTYLNALNAGIYVLEKAHIADARLDAWYLLARAAKIDRNYYYMHQTEEMSDEIKIEYVAAITKRAERIPLQYILGEQEFMGFTFKVTNAVLIPRQDTETLVEEALHLLMPKDKVLDLCTGSGCIIISLSLLSKEIKAYGSDLSKQALLVAKENAKNNGAVVEWIRSDLFENIHEKFQVIVSNPPYIPTEVIMELEPEVRDYEPQEALDGREDGYYFYRKIIEKASDYLEKDGWLALEIGYDQAAEVCDLLEEQGFSQVSVKKDLAGLDRVIIAQNC